MQKKPNDKEKLVRLNFDLPLSMRIAFKSKVASENKNVKDVLTELISDYLKRSNKEKH